MLRRVCFFRGGISKDKIIENHLNNHLDNLSEYIFKHIVCRHGVTDNIASFACASAVGAFSGACFSACFVVMDIFAPFAIGMVGKRQRSFVLRKSAKSADVGAGAV